MKLRAVIERITYQNGENGYSILKARVKGYDDLVTLVGNMLDVTVGTVLVAEGQWKVNRLYGSQFVVETYEEAMPATLFGLEKYLGSGLVKGIGPKFSKLIVARFGMDTFDIIEKDSQRLGEVDGIGPKRIKKIHDSWMKQLDIRDVMVFLQGNGVSTAYAAKIYKAYGKESIDKVKQNPYCLADDIWGIGFKTADSIASKMGYGKNDERRCRSGILYTLNQLANEGHVYAERDQLVDAGVKLLEADKASIESALDQMIAAEDLKTEDEAIYLPPFYFSEVGTTNNLKTLLTTHQQNIKRQMELLTSIKGIGATLTAALIITTGRFTYFSNAKQLTRYLGLSPTYQQSGTSVHIRGHINHNGDPMLRDQLYIGALSALRSNTECRACYNRLQENGYPGKVAVVAVANKLIRQAFAVVTQGVPYEDGHVSKLHSASANVTA